MKRAKKITAFDCKCEKCGHEWTAKNTLPLRCAKCKTPYWDRPQKSNH